MKKVFLLLFLYWQASALYAQVSKYNNQREVRGSGILIQKDRTVTPFQAIDIHPFISKVLIEVGGTQSVVSVQVDDNLNAFLRIENVDGVLTLGFRDPDNKPFWLGKGTIDITIKTPSLSRLRNESNGDVVINNLTGESFDLTNQGNGNVTLRGTITQLNVVSSANGDVRAEGLIVQKAHVLTQANATVSVNARQLSSQKLGHATIRNIAEPAGRSVTRETTRTQNASTEDLVTVILQNNSPASRTVTLRFTEPGKPIYGLVNTTLGPYGKRRETYPVGTKIEQISTEQQKITMTGAEVPGKTIATLKVDDNGRTYDLPD